MGICKSAPEFFTRDDDEGLDVLIEQASSERPGTQLKGIKRLLHLAQYTETCLKLLQKPRALEVLVRVAQRGQTEEAQSLALECIVEMTRLDDELCHRHLFATPGLVEVALRAAKKGRTLVIKGQGLTILGGLTGAASNRVTLFKMYGVVETMLEAARDEKSDGIRALGMMGLAGLALAPSNALEMAQNQFILEAMIRAAESKFEDDTHHAGLYGLAAFAQVHIPTRNLIIENDVITKAMARAWKDGTTLEIKQLGIAGMSALAFSPKLLLEKVPDIMDRVFDTLNDDAEFTLLKQDVLKIIGNVTEDREIAHQLIVHEHLLTWLMILPITREWARITLNLAVWPETRAHIVQEKSMTEKLKRELETLQNPTIVVLCKMTLAILIGDDEFPSAFRYVPDDMDLMDFTAILESTLQQRDSYGISWQLIHPLACLRVLCTVEETRRQLGSEWTSSLLQAMAQSWTKNLPLVAEYALQCLLHCTFDRTTLAVLQNDKSCAKLASTMIELKHSEKEWADVVFCAECLLIRLRVNQKPVFQKLLAKGEEEKQPDFPIMDVRLEQALRGMEVEANSEGTISFSTDNESQASVLLSHLPDDKITRKKVLILKCRSAIGCGQCEKNENFHALISGLQGKDFDILHDDENGGWNPLKFIDIVNHADAVLIVISKAFKQCATCRFFLTSAIDHEKRLIPVLAEKGYNFELDGWLGTTLGDFVYYDISSVDKCEREIHALLESALSHQSFMNPDQTSPRMQRALEGKESIIRWSKKAGLSKEIVEALLKEGFETEETLRALATKSTSEIKTLLGLEKAAMALKLEMELKKALVIV